MTRMGASLPPLLALALTNKQMCKGCTEEERAEWHLGSTDEYRYLAASGAADVASINDVKAGRMPCDCAHVW